MIALDGGGLGARRGLLLAAGSLLAGCDTVCFPMLGCGPLRILRSGVVTVALSSDGALVAAEYWPTPLDTLHERAFGRLAFYDARSRLIMRVDAPKEQGFRQPSFSPDDRFIVAVRVLAKRWSAPFDVAMVEVGSSRLRSVSGPLPRSPALPRVAPDGNGVLYAMSDESGRGENHLVYQPLPDGVPTRIDIGGENFAGLTGLFFLGVDEVLFVALPRTDSSAAKANVEFGRSPYHPVIYRLALRDALTSKALPEMLRPQPAGTEGIGPYHLQASRNGAVLAWVGRFPAEAGIRRLTEHDILELRDGRLRRILDLGTRAYSGFALSADAGRMALTTLDDGSRRFSELSLIDVRSGEVMATDLGRRLTRGGFDSDPSRKVVLFE